MLMLNIHLAISELCQGSQHPCLFLHFGLFSAKKLLRLPIILRSGCASNSVGISLI